jgi:hypothetical protein
LHQHASVGQRQHKARMGGLLGTFFLKDFDNFFNDYNLNNVLVQEALIALDNFLPALNEFFDLCEELTDAKDSKISWYGYTNVASSGDYIRAKSVYYNEPSFSDVSINMSEEETGDYNTYEGACFGKVGMILLVVFISVFSLTIIKNVNNNTDFYYIGRFLCYLMLKLTMIHLSILPLYNSMIFAIKMMNDVYTSTIALYYKK